VALAAGALATVRAATPGTHGVRCAYQQGGHRGLAASKGRKAGLGAGGPRGGTVPPHPSQVATLRCWTNGL
jgi:hypothetical protein